MFSIGPNHEFWLKYPVSVNFEFSVRISPAMSSSNRSHDLLPEGGHRGWIVQGERVVGGLDLPPEVADFVERFNREYAAMGMRVVPSGGQGGPAEPVTEAKFSG